MIWVIGGSKIAIAQTAEKPAVPAVAPTPEERKAAQIKQIIDRMPIVAKPMTAADVEVLFKRVGLLPLEDSAQKPFADWLALAVATSDESRNAFKDGPFKEASVKFSAKIETEGCPSRDQGSLIKELRAQVLAIDIALITTTAAPIAANAVAADANAAVMRLIEQAKWLRRADAADETILKGAFPLPFATITPAFAVIEPLPVHQFTAARALLLSDAAARADLAERLSYAILEGFVLMAGETAIAVQTAARNMAEGEKIDGLELTGVALSIQVGAVSDAMSTMANLNVALEQAIQSQFSPRVAYEVIQTLDSGLMRNPAFRSATVRTISDLETSALALAGITPEQSRSISDIATAWRSVEVQTFISQLQTDVPLMAQLAAVARGIVASDPKTWSGGKGTSSAQEKLNQMSIKRNEQGISRRAASDRATKAIEQVLGQELWLQLNPKR